MTSTGLDLDPSFEYWWEVVQTGAIVESMDLRKSIVVFRNPDDSRFQVDLFTDLAHLVTH